MLDIKKIREDYEGMKAGVERRTKGSFGIEHIPEIDAKIRAAKGEVEPMKATLNKVSKQIGVLKKNGEDATEIMAEMKKLSADIKAKDEEISKLESDIRDVLLGIPNIPADHVP